MHGMYFGTPYQLMAASGVVAPGSTGLFGDGSAAAPSISFSADSNTGFFRDAADQIAITLGGTKYGVLWASGGAFRIHTLSSGRLDLGSDGNPYLSMLANSSLSAQLNFNQTKFGSGGTDGNFLLTNNAGTSFGLLQFGGTTSSFPAWKRSGTTVQARLADDSGFTDVSAAIFSVNTGSTINGYFDGVNKHIALGSDWGIKFYSAPTGFGTLDLRMTRQAAKTWVVDAGTDGLGADLAVGGQASLKGQQAVVKSLVTGSGTLSGTTVTLTGAIPASSLVLGVTARVTTTITGPASWLLGTVGDTDLYGAALNLAQNTTVDINNYTAEPNMFYAAATDLVITRGTAVNFTAGVVSVTVHYIDLTPATSN